MDTFEEAFIAGTAPTSYCPLHGFSISDAVGEGVGKVLGGIGKIIGGIFGAGGGDKQEQQPEGR